MSRAGEIRARLDAATPGPWELASADSGPHDFVVHTVDEDWTNIAWSSSRHGRDADLIAHAPTDLRDLLAVAEAARRYRDRWIDTTFAPDDIETAALFDALVRLDAVTGGEQ